MRAQIIGLLFPFLTSRGWIVTSSQNSLNSWYERWTLPVFPYWPVVLSPPPGLQRGCVTFHSPGLWTSFPSELSAPVTLTSLHSTHWPWAQSVTRSPTQFCSTRWQGAVGREGRLGEYSAICLSPVVLSITFLFLRLHVEIWGSEHTNPGLVPLGSSQSGGDAETGTRTLIRS